MVNNSVSIASGGHRERVLARRDALVVEHLALVPPIARRIHATLPPSFDLDEMIGVGNFALVRAATRYQPRAHNNTPFTAYARAAIRGAIKDTFRRNKFAEQTRPSVDNLLEFPVHTQRAVPEIDARIVLAERFAMLRVYVTCHLTALQAAVVNEYYSPALPDLKTVAANIGITRRQAEKAHASAVRTLKEMLKLAA